jgi:hypothetical protein
MKARSAECLARSPLNAEQVFRVKKRGWNDDKTFVITKEQQAKLSIDDFEAIQRIGEALYGKGCK